MSAIGALWNVTRVFQEQEEQHGMPTKAGIAACSESKVPTRTGRVYGNAQWRPTARSHGYLSQVYARVCDYTGLIGQYDKDVVERTWALTNSVEAQSAVVVALRWH